MQADSPERTYTTAESEVRNEAEVIHVEQPSAPSLRTNGVDMKQDSNKKNPNVGDLFDGTEDAFESVQFRSVAHFQGNIFIMTRIRGGAFKEPEPESLNLGLTFSRSPCIFPCIKFRLKRDNQGSKSSEYDQYTYPVNYTFDQYDDNARIYNVLRRFLSGGLEIQPKTCIIADGQSNTGKSYTMFQGRNALIPSALEIFFLSAEKQDSWRDHSHTHISCSIGEYSMDGIKDLADHGKRVQHLVRFPLTNLADALAISGRAWSLR